MAPFKIFSLAAAFAASAGISVLLTGCGATPGLPSADSVPTQSMNGIVHGGPNPIAGASVTLYETQVSSTSGYANTAPKVLATATSGNYGQFSFTAGYTCSTAPYMQYVYVAVTGGNTGSGTNNNSVLMAALGPCSSFASTAAQNATQIFISEATTVAAAYALGNFTAVSGSSGSQVVTVSSTATNDSITPGCTGTGASMSCTANGLGHAFANATAIANGVSFGGVGGANGLINTTVASYPGSSIPQAMLNVVADALQACVNSAGGSVVSGASDNSPCGNLFFASTPASGTAPTDTLSAAMNIARYPLNAATVSSTSGIYSLVTSSSYFQPSLAAAPADYSLGLYYPGTINGTAYMPYPYALTLDAADNIYVLSADNNTPSTFSATPTTGNITQTGVAGFTQGTSGLAPLYPYTTGSSTNYTVPGNIVADALGNVFASNPTNVTTSNLIREYSAASGAVTESFMPTSGTPATTVNFVSAMALDHNGLLWASTLNPTSGVGVNTYRAAIYQFPTNGVAVAGVAAANSSNYSGVLNTQQANLDGIAIDQYQNVWSCSNGSAAGSATNTQPKMYGYPNTGAAAGTAPYAGVPPAYSGQLGGNPIGGPAIDASGNIYCPNRKQIMLGVPVETQGIISGSPSVSIQYYSGTPAIVDLSTGAQLDGNNNYVQEGRSAAGKFVVTPIVNATAGSTTIGGTPANLDPCFPVVSTTNQAFYCSTNQTAFPTGGTQVFFSLINNAGAQQIDSTGSTWIAVGTSSTTTGTPNGLVQMIGPVAPVWPLLEYTRPGVKP